MTTYIRDLESDFHDLIELMVAMIDARAESPMTPGMEWLNDIQTLSVKLFKQLCSTKSLADGCMFQSATGKEIGFIDHGSIFILARAAIENFLVLHRIFSSPPEQAKFRHALWQYAGLADRASLTTSTDEGRIKQASAKMQMAELLEVIEASPLLSSYSAKEIKELKKGNWRVGWSWGSEAVKAGFHKAYFDNMYGHLCGYSHSNYISAMQIGQAQEVEDQEKLGRSGVQICIHIMAHFIHLYASTFPLAAEILAASSTKTTAELWHFKAEHMDHFYDQQKT